MNGKAFDGLSKLADVSLIDNICISQNFDEKTQIASLSGVVNEKCGFIETSDLDRLFKIDCGEPTFIEGLVIGGKESARGRFPFIAALKHSKTKKYFCGGSLITSQHVLTGEQSI
jgi:hypothetical protein